MDIFPVQPVTPWGNPVMVGVRCSGEANGAGDGTVDWGADGCRQQPHDKGSKSEAPTIPISEQ